MAMWNLFQMAKTCGSKPSNFLGLPPHDWATYQFDQAVVVFGLGIESKMSKRDKKGRPIHRLKELLAPERGAHRAVRSARHLVRRRVRIGPSGTW